MILHRVTVRESQADCMYRGFGPTSLAGLRDARASKPCIAMTREQLLKGEESTKIRGNVDEDWKAWQTNNVPRLEVQGANSPPTFTLLMCPRRDPPPGAGHDRFAISSLPASRERSLDIFTKLYVPDSFLDAIVRPRTLFRKLSTFVEGQPCEVYMLTVDSILENFTAINITYFPRSKQVFCLYLGYVQTIQLDHAKDMHTRLVRNAAFLQHPFTMLGAFFESEKRHRLAEVDDMIDQMKRREKFGPSKFEDSGTQPLERSGFEKFRFEDLYNRVGNLQVQLALWQPQLDKLVKACEKMPKVETTHAGGFVIDFEEYVQGVKESFTESSLRCNNILQTMSLVFQKEQTNWALKDAKQMKAIALLTMFFLPGTAIASLMQASIINWNSNPNLFWALTIPVTIAVLFIYVFWVLYVDEIKAWIAWRWKRNPGS